MRGDIPDQYARLNADDQKAFNRWLWANTVVGVILLAGLIVVAAKFSGDNSVASVQNSPTKSSSTGPTQRQGIKSESAARSLIGSNKYFDRR